MRQDGPTDRLREGLLLLTLLGAFLSLRGYRSFEGDQAYRFPMLLAAWEPGLYPADPFVASFGEFNPHRGALGVIGTLGRAVGLSTALAALFVTTFLLTVQGVRTIAGAVWPEQPRTAGLAAALLFLATLAGNIGTNHLFEPIVLDRQIALGLLWFGLARFLVEPGRGAIAMALALGASAIIHPTFTLQTAVILGASTLLWGCLGRADGASWRTIVGAVGLQGLALLPGLAINLRGSGTVLEGLPVETFRLLSLELQGPQHMVPHLWRMPQWLAWACFPLLAGLAVWEGQRADRPTSGARDRLVILLGVTLGWLAAAWVGVEVVGHLRLTLFQPFRMATVCRGLCLLLVAGHVARLWGRQGDLDRTRAALLLVGLTGDWSLVVVTAFELTMSLGDWAEARWETGRAGHWLRSGIGLAVLAGGLIFLARHDTESGQVPILVTLVATPLLNRLARSWRPTLTTGRRLRIAAACWLIPATSLVLGVLGVEEGSRVQVVRDWLVKRCRFAEVPVDDVERLALWCRANTPTDAVFVGPPGPKTFRLWSRRSLAFNRAGSPYNARGLDDWARRFAEHVGVPPEPEALVRAYLRDRHGLERGYDRLSPAELARLGQRQGADYLIVRQRTETDPSAFAAAGLDCVRVEGRYALYRRTDGDRLASRSPTRP